MFFGQFPFAVILQRSPGLEEPVYLSLGVEICDALWRTEMYFYDFAFINFEDYPGHTIAKALEILYIAVPVLSSRFGIVAWHRIAIVGNELKGG
jgi:hypothetical protein